MKKQNVLILLFSILIASAFVVAKDYKDSQNRIRKDIPIKPNLIVPFDSIFVNLQDEMLLKKQHKIDSIFRRIRNRNGLNGTVLYAEKGQIVYKGAFGRRNIYNGDPIKVEDAFQLASVSKMFAATAIMILYEEGKLSYDDDLKNYFESFPYEGITIRHLLNHRSGLPRYMSLALENWGDKTIPLDNDNMMNLFVKYAPKPYFRSGRGFNYCNTNYAILANIVELCSGVPFDIYVREKIFKKCGMDNSFVYQMREDTCVSDYIVQGVPGYHCGYRIRRIPNDYLNGVMGDKNVYSTVEDLFRFDQALKKGTIISLETQQEAYTPGTLRTGRKDYYGFGWRIDKDRDSTVYHYGWWKGFRTCFIRDLANDKTIIALTNSDRSTGSQHLWQIIDDQSFELPPVCSIPQEEDSTDSYAMIKQEEIDNDSDVRG